MIISGGSRRGAKWFATHLMRRDGGQEVRLAEARGLAGYDIPGWFRQMEAVSFGTRCENYFYHASISPRADEALTEPQWDQAIDTLEHNLGLDGHSRFVVEHEKDGRTHRHVFWSRIDPDTMTAVSDSKTYRIHERTADELEQLFGHEATPRGHGPHGRNPDNWEVFRGKKHGFDPYAVGEELTALWHQCDTGKALAAAIEAHGYILAEGDRGLCVIDPSGKEHSLARRIDGARKRDVDARMADIDRDALPTVAQARQLARERKDDVADAPSPDASHHAHKHDSSTLFAEVAEELLHAVKQRRKEAEEKSPEPEPASHTPTEPSPFERVAQELVQTARSVPLRDELAAVSEPVSEFERVTAEVKAALRDGGEEAWFAAGLYWMAQKLKDSFAGGAPARERTPFDEVAEEVKQAARNNGGEPVSATGQSFWRRGVAMVANAYDHALSWAWETAQGFADRLFQSRAAEHDDPERER